MTNAEIISIIDFAIENEIEAYEFYRDAAIKIKHVVLKETFEDLAKEELEHKKFLEEFVASGIKTMDIKEVDDYKIAETLDKPVLSVEMKFSDALALAIKKEEEAMIMYKNLAESTDNEEYRDMFVGLMDMEKQHKTKLEEIYLNAAYGEVW